MKEKKIDNNLSKQCQKTPLENAEILNLMLENAKLRSKIKKLLATIDFLSGCE